MIWTAPKIWEDATCFILGGGPSLPRQFDVPESIIESVSNKKQLPSAYSKYLEPLHDKHIIGINNTYQIGNWIDVLFFGDCSWYLVHRNALSKWPGLKVTCCNRFEGKTKKESEGIKYLKKNTTKRLGISNNPQTVCWNSNSGAASISLARHFGVKRIVLLGFDMDISNGKSHWHGSHGNENMRRPPYARHLKGFPDIFSDAKQYGIEILNCSQTSKINDFPKVKLKDVL